MEQRYGVSNINKVMEAIYISVWSRAKESLEHDCKKTVQVLTD